MLVPNCFCADNNNRVYAVTAGSSDLQTSTEYILYPSQVLLKVLLLLSFRKRANSTVRTTQFGIVLSQTLIWTNLMK